MSHFASKVNSYFPIYFCHFGFNLPSTEGERGQEAMWEREGEKDRERTTGRDSNSGHLKRVNTPYVDLSTSLFTPLINS